MFERLAEMEARYEELSRLLADPEVLADHRRVQEIGRERATLEATVRAYRLYRETDAALDDARVLARDSDEEVRALGREEEERLTLAVARLEEELKLALLPRDPADDRDVIVEIRAGTGGEEAALFAADLFEHALRIAGGSG